MKDIAFREQKQHGSADFPIAYYRVDEEYPQYVMPLHWHRELEIVAVRRGHLRIFLNNAAYEMEAGDILFIGSGVLHRAEPEGCLYECVVFDPNMLGRRLQEHYLPLLSGEREICAFFPAGEGAIQETTAQLCAQMAGRKEHYQLAVHGALANLLYYLYAGNHIHTPERVGRGGHQAETVARVVRYIDENYREKITLQALADRAAVHEKYLCRIFKEFTGRTPIDYVNQLRIDHACIDLTLHHKNVTEAALDVGFTDVSYFTKLFKRTKGVTPREYARREK